MLQWGIYTPWYALKYMLYVNICLIRYKYMLKYAKNSIAPCLSVKVPFKSWAAGGSRPHGL